MVGEAVNRENRMELFSILFTSFRRATLTLVSVFTVALIRRNGSLSRSIATCDNETLSGPIYRYGHNGYFFLFATAHELLYIPRYMFHFRQAKSGAYNGVRPIVHTSTHLLCLPVDVFCIWRERFSLGKWRVSVFVFLKSAEVCWTLLA